MRSVSTGSQLESRATLALSTRCGRQHQRVRGKAGGGGRGRHRWRHPLPQARIEVADNTAGRLMILRIDWPSATTEAAISAVSRGGYCAIVSAYHLPTLTKGGTNSWRT